jgi:hypothetical protein
VLKDICSGRVESDHIEFYLFPVPVAVTVIVHSKSKGGDMLNVAAFLKNSKFVRFSERFV